MSVSTYQWPCDHQTISYSNKKKLKKILLVSFQRTELSQESPGQREKGQQGSSLWVVTVMWATAVRLFFPVVRPSDQLRAFLPRAPQTHLWYWAVKVRFPLGKAGNSHCRMFLKLTEFILTFSGGGTIPNAVKIKGKCLHLCSSKRLH